MNTVAPTRNCAGRSTIPSLTVTRAPKSRTCLRYPRSEAKIKMAKMAGTSFFTFTFLVLPFAFVRGAAALYFKNYLRLPGPRARHAVASHHKSRS